MSKSILNKFHRMTQAIRRQLVTFLACVLLLQGTAVDVMAQSLPEFFGVYLMEGNQFIDLKSSKATTSTEQSTPQFLRYENKSELQSKLTIGRYDYLNERQVIDIDGRVTSSVKVNKWTPSDGTVEGREKPFSGSKDAVVWVPREQLQPGFYEVRSLTGSHGYFVVKGAQLTDLLRHPNCINIQIGLQNMNGVKVPCTQSANVDGAPLRREGSAGTNRQSDGPIPSDLPDLAFLAGKWCHKQNRGMVSNFRPSSSSRNEFELELTIDGTGGSRNVYRGEVTVIKTIACYC